MIQTHSQEGTAGAQVPPESPGTNKEHRKEEKKAVVHVVTL